MDYAMGMLVLGMYVSTVAFGAILAVMIPYTIIAIVCKVTDKIRIWKRQ